MHILFFLHAVARVDKNKNVTEFSIMTTGAGNTQRYFDMRDALFYASAPVLIIGGLNWLATGINNVRKGDAATKSDDLLNGLGLPTQLINIVYIIVGIAAIGMLFYGYMRTFGAPDMLNTTFFPSTLTVAERTPDNATAAVKIQVTPFAKVAFWAAQSAIQKDTPYLSYDEAYGDYSNAGVAIADAAGVAVLRFRSPNGYMVRGTKLKPHVHYRVARAPKVDASGISIDEKRHEAHQWSAVQTVFDFQEFTKKQ